MCKADDIDDSLQSQEILLVMLQKIAPHKLPNYDSTDLVLSGTSSRSRTCKLRGTDYYRLIAEHMMTDPLLDTLKDGVNSYGVACLRRSQGSADVNFPGDAVYYR